MRMHACMRAAPDLSLVPPPLPPGLLPDVKPADFNNYKRRYAGRLARFEALRQSGSASTRLDSDDLAPGEAACTLRRAVRLQRWAAPDS